MYTFVLIDADEKDLNATCIQCNNSDLIAYIAIANYSYISS